MWPIVLFSLPPPPLPPALLLKIVTTSPPFSNSPWFIFWFWLGRGWITLYFLAQGRAEGVHTNAFAVPNQSPDSAEPSRYAAENQAATPTTGCKNPVHRWGDIQIYLGSNLSWLWWKLPLNAFLGQLMRLARIFGACNDPWHNSLRVFLCRLAHASTHGHHDRSHTSW